MKVVGIKFRDHGRICDYDSSEVSLKEKDIVMVDTEHGPELGFVARVPMERNPACFCKPLRKIIRLADESDMEQGQRNLFQEREAKRLCLAKIKEQNLPMKLIGVESFLDGSKIIFYFVSEGRVDFRALVKELASALKTRIEMRQVGVRNEAKMIGGLGVCGRCLCCTTFMRTFEPVTIQKARKQQIVINPTKISGLCGRLMCCLAFEEQSRGRMYSESNDREIED